MLTPGQTLPLTIEKPAAGGRMIARVEGQVVLVAGAIPGEHVTARVERVGRGVAYADVISVDEASPDRRVPAFDPVCGGCHYAHITIDRQREVKGLVIEDGLTRIGRIALPSPVHVHPSPEEAYRMRARLHARRGRIGFFLEGTHEVCDARATRQLRDDACDTLDRLAAGLRSLAMEEVRELELSENIDASQRVVHLEVAVPIGPRVLRGLGLSDGLTGLTLTQAQLKGAERTAVVSGDPHVVDTLAFDEGRIQLRRHVRAFFQGNRFLLASLVQHVVSRVGAGDRVVDLYAGTGLFSVAAAVLKGAQVLAVEGDRTGAADLDANAAATNGGVKAVHESVEAFVQRGHNAPAVVIVDPPRTGMSNEAVDGVLKLKAPTLVYVSCDVATLARDARKLTEAGYRCDHVTGFDLFPNTPHVETVVTFRR
jgi:23S rRNA (uracil1939-C5)-methyltransferase